MNHEYWMEKALQLADQAADMGEVPVGALVLYQNEIIGAGWNQPIYQHDPSAHAEMMALRAAAQTLNNYRLIDCSLYVTLEPCTMCAGAMMHARIKHLVFGAADHKTGAAGSVFDVVQDGRYNHQINCQGGVLAAQAAQRLQDFFKQRRAQKKAAKRLLSS